MKNFWPVLGFLIALGLLIGGIVLLVATEGVPSRISYEGKLTFHTAEEYSEFKDYIINPNVEIKDIDVIMEADYPPILVVYSVWVPGDYDFPYEYEDKWENISEVEVAGILMVTIGAGIAIGISIIVHTEPEEETKKEEIY